MSRKASGIESLPIDSFTIKILRAKRSSRQARKPYVYSNKITKPLLFPEKNLICRLVRSKHPPAEAGGLREIGPSSERPFNFSKKSYTYRS